MTAFRIAALAVLACGCVPMHRPAGGHFVRHGFYQADGRYRVRALSESPETTLVRDDWELVGFGPPRGGVPGLERGARRGYDFRYRHAARGTIWARTIANPVLPSFPGSPDNWPRLARPPVEAASSWRLVSYGPAMVDGEHAWMITFDLSDRTRGGSEDVRVTAVIVRPGYHPSAFFRGRSPPVVVFGYLSPVGRHADGLAELESLLSRVDFAPG